MVKLVLSCDGVPERLANQAALDITEEFTHRPWHRKVACRWDGSRLLLEAETDHDPEGLALQDEFSDAISASISEGFDGDIRVVIVREL